MVESPELCARGRVRGIKTAQAGALSLVIARRSLRWVLRSQHEYKNKVDIRNIQHTAAQETKYAEECNAIIQFCADTNVGWLVGWLVGWANCDLWAVGAPQSPCTYVQASPLCEHSNR